MEALSKKTSFIICFIQKHELKHTSRQACVKFLYQPISTKFKYKRKSIYLKFFTLPFTTLRNYHDELKYQIIKFWGTAK